MKYKIRQGQNIFDLNPGLHAVAEFDVLEPRQMFVVAIFADPSRDNPISTLAGKARREAAVKLAGYGYESDGKRLDKNARIVIYGQNKRIEAAIEKFKELHYNQRQHSIEALKTQIEEIREFLVSDKSKYIVDKGQIVLDKEGTPLRELDPKLLKLAVELAKELPSLEEALEKLEIANKEEDTKFEGATFSSADVELEEFIEEDAPPLIEMVMPKIRENG